MEKVFNLEQCGQKELLQFSRKDHLTIHHFSTSLTLKHSQFFLYNYKKYTSTDHA